VRDMDGIDSIGYNVTIGLLSTALAGCCYRRKRNWPYVQISNAMMFFSTIVSIFCVLSCIVR
jgi:hypothetical protein